MPAAQHSPRSTTTVRELANYPPYSPAKMPTQKYRKNELDSERTTLFPLLDVRFDMSSKSASSVISEPEVLYVSDSSDLDVIAISTHTISRQQLQLDLQEATQRASNAHKSPPQAKRDFTDRCMSDLQSYMCPICHSTLNEPHSLACGHIFCAKCISDWAHYHHNRNKNPVCPTCRKFIGYFTPVLVYLLKESIECALKDVGIIPSLSTGLPNSVVNAPSFSTPISLRDGSE
ncbi:hypothetical protein BDP27DRAFT_1374021 [Rhodocollybia butyracea]|uniref:RING-type domain-containing protein n=1 Tax=Rhodocollybia butyracea TaxID=206335 RepID=A0A9P5P5T2_9AGAR|nr:hypothetical protein BDP27DRAFT_1374021 [Rhodocollybia butyracea]